MTCGKRLAPEQWWNFCGETDMGQTMPVQCTECGGEYTLASPEVQAESDRKKAERDQRNPNHKGWVEPLYNTPPQHTWVGLSDEDFQPMVQKAMVYYGYKPEHSTLTSGAGFYALVRAIEAKLKEKNT